MTPAPIIIFVYNRPDHTRRTVEALAKNDLAKDSDLFIFSDGPKNEGAAPKVQAVRDYLKTIAPEGWFKSVTVIEAPKNKGLADSIISGVSQVISERGTVIVLEDDLVTSVDFLQYMNDSLEFYRNEPKVGSITGFSYPLEFPSDYKDSVYVLGRTCSLGWGTWADRWNAIDWEVKDFDEFSKDRQARAQFDSFGADRYDRLRRQLQEGANSWSIRFGYCQFRQGRVTIYPVQGRLENIGIDGSGVHLNSAELAGSIQDGPVPYTLTLPPVDERLRRQMVAIFEGGLSTKIGRYLRNNGMGRFEAKLKKLVKGR